MGHLCSITRIQEALLRAFRVKRDRTGKVSYLAAAYLDSLAPVVHSALVGERELSMMRWRLSASAYLGKASVTNVRNM